MRSLMLKIFILTLLVILIRNIVFAEETPAPAPTDSPLEMIIKGKYQDEIVVEKISQPEHLEFSDFISSFQFSIQNLESNDRMPEKIYFPPDLIDSPQLSFSSPLISYPPPALENVTSWDIQIIDKNGKTVVYNSGKGLPPKLFTWESGQELNPEVGDVYSLVYSWKDNRGLSHSEEKSIKISNLVKVNKDENIITLSLESILSTRPELKMLAQSENLDFLLKAIKQNSDLPLSIRLSYPDLIEGKRILDFILNFVSAQLSLLPEIFDAKLIVDTNPIPLLELRIKKSVKKYAQSQSSISQYLNLAEKYLSLGLVGAAIEEYRFLLTVKPKSNQSRKRLSKLERQEIGFHENLGKKFFNEKSYQKANQEFKYALAIAEDSLVNKNLKKDLQKYLEKCNAEISRENEKQEQINTNFYQGLVFYKQGNYPQSIDRLVKVLQYDPLHQQAKLYIDLAGKKLVKD